MAAGNWTADANKADRAKQGQGTGIFIKVHVNLGLIKASAIGNLDSRVGL
jgi:hypothetical protein